MIRFNFLITLIPICLIGLYDMQNNLSTIISKKMQVRRLALFYFVFTFPYFV